LMKPSSQTRVSDNLQFDDRGNDSLDKWFWAKSSDFGDFVSLTTSLQML
jgi:hypothetical protein